MRNDENKAQGRSNGFFPTSFRAISTYLRIVSSGASSVASTVRLAGASVVNSISDREEDSGRNRVRWAGFDKLECKSGYTLRVLLLGYRTGFQVWDVEESNDVRELVSKQDGLVAFLQMLQKPNNIQAGFGSACNGSASGYPELGNGNNIGPTVLQFYSVKSHSYVHALKFRSAVYSVRCSPCIVAIAQTAQVHCFDAATIESVYIVVSNPITSGCHGPGGLGMGYGPLAVGTRWLAYSGSPVIVNSNTGRVAPAPNPSAAPNGSLVVHCSKESSKQIAVGIVTLGDMGYKKLSKYCSDLLPDCSNSFRVVNSNCRSNGVVGHAIEAEHVGMVIIRDIISKSVVTQFRAYKNPISALCFDPSGTLLVTAAVQGHNINIFRIMPPPFGDSPVFDFFPSYTHLYRLQRGFTNAVIQDISFSDDSRWIMIGSSKGTSHLFAISPFGGNMGPQSNEATMVNSGHDGMFSFTRPGVRWPPTSCSSKHNHFVPGSPVTLSAVSRIRNGNNGWRAAVNGAAAAATGRVNNALSGATASSFHDCNSGSYLDSRIKHHLLVFSLCGFVIEYGLRLTPGEERLNTVSDASGPGNIYESGQDHDMRLVIETLWKWNVSHSQNRAAEEENVDIYGESGDSYKLLPKGYKNSATVYPTNSGMPKRERLTSEEKHHLYISNAELQMHHAQTPIWVRPEMYFQVFLMDNVRMEKLNDLYEEIEIERVPTRTIEARSKDLVPVIDSLPDSKFSGFRCVFTCFGGWPCNGSPLQKWEAFEDGKLSRRSSCGSLDCFGGGGRLSTESTEGFFVNTGGSPMM
ncbi:hypothetical protein AMTRI_Chr02g259110 [Amborella trichopoda]